MEPQKNSEQTGKKRNPFLFFLTLKGIFILPIVLIVIILFSLMVSSTFYVSVLKNAGLIESYIQAKNWQMEKEIKAEIEEDVKLEEFRKKFEVIKEDYENKKETYYTLNLKNEYKTLKAKYNELDDLSFSSAPDLFKSKADFKKYKKDELKKIKAEMKEIEKYRDLNEEKIDRARDSYKEIKDTYEDAVDDLEDKEEDARDIIKSHKNSFMGKIYTDIGIISPVLTEALNSKLLEKGVRAEIDKMLAFITSYNEQVKRGAIYTDTLGITQGRVASARKVKLPPITISLWVDDEIRGVQQKRHLLSQVFVSRIADMKGLHNKASFIQIFKFSETGLAERIGRKYLKGAGFTLRDGVIRLKPIVLTGSTARGFETLMIVATWGVYVRYVLLGGLALLILLMMASGAESEKKKRSIRKVLLWPSILVIVVSIGVIIFSGTFTSLFPWVIKDPLVQAYAKRIAMVISLHLFVPMIFIFGLLAFIGSFVGKKKKSEKAA